MLSHKHIKVLIFIMFLSLFFVSCSTNNIDNLHHFESSDECLITSSPIVTDKQSPEELKTTESKPAVEIPLIPYIGMKESDIQTTRLGVAALTHESGGFWGGEEHIYHHYTFYYRYPTYTVVVFSVRTHNGIVDQIEDRRDSPIRVSDERHRTMLASGTPVNYVGK